MKYKCIIVDDEPLAHVVLKQHIAREKQVEVAADFYNAADALDWLQKNVCDLVFLDIKMPEMSGLEFLKQLDEPPLTIFTTAYRNYALEGFELGVMDYLLKPVSFSRFQLGVSRVIDFLKLKHTGDELLKSNTTAEKENITIKSGTKLISLPLYSISHIQGLKDYAIFYAGTKKYVVKGYIKLIAGMLPPGLFTRVHKSFIVANAKIKLVSRGRIEFDGHQVPVGRNYKAVVDSFFNQKNPFTP